MYLIALYIHSQLNDPKIPLWQLDTIYFPSNFTIKFRFQLKFSYYFI